jgi:uncharacterized protein (TIGR03545 family)
MNWIKTIGFTLLGGALAVFNLLFLDGLAERGLEQALETVFHARAEVEKLDISPLAARVTFEGITVADEARPMKNLFQIGYTDVDIEFQELLKRKIVIENMVSTNIRWGTDRQTSGALPGAADRTESGTVAEAAGGVLDSIGVDPEEVLQQEWDNLKSPQALQELGDAIETAAGVWEDAMPQVEQDLATIERSVQTAREIDVDSIDSADEAREALEAVKEVSDGLRTAKTGLENTRSDLERETATLKGVTTAAETALQEDRDYLESRVGLPEGGVRGVLSGLARGLIAEKLGRFSSLAFRAMDYAGGFDEKEQSKAEAPGRRGGQDVPFQTVDYPRFLIQNFLFSVSEGDRNLEGGIRDLASDPDVWGRPTSFSAQMADGEKSLEIDGTYDGREDVRAYRLAVSGSGYEFAADSIPRMEGWEGTYRFETEFQVDSQETTSGRARILLTDMILPDPEGADLVTEIVTDAIRRAQEVTFDISYKTEDGEMELEISSNLDQEISREVSRRVRELVADYQAQMEQRLQERLEPILEENANRVQRLTELQGQMGDYEDRVAGYQAEMDKKRDEISRRASQGVQDALKEGAGKLKLPKLGR